MGSRQQLFIEIPSRLLLVRDAQQTRGETTPCLGVSPGFTEKPEGDHYQLTSQCPPHSVEMCTFPSSRAPRIQLPDGKYCETVWTTTRRPLGPRDRQDSLKIVAVGIMQSITDLAGLYRDPVVAALQGRRDVFFLHELANVIGGCPHRRAISISPPRHSTQHLESAISGGCTFRCTLTADREGPGESTTEVIQILKKRNVVAVDR
jgi:hypothetical protein